MDIIPEQQPYIQEINADWYEGKVTEVSMLRLDAVHHQVSGNKWYKLKYNVEYCRSHGIGTILTFGGAYSNHLAATAAMANISGLKSIGVIKGTYAEKELTPTLRFCRDNGMELVFVTHEDYARKYDEDWLRYLSARFNYPMIIPEGGANEYGRKGAREIAELIPERFTHVAVSVGTGTTLTGIVDNVGGDVRVLGFAPMKGGKYLQNEISKYVPAMNFTIYDDWHFGGFGKHTAELVVFMNQFYLENNIPLDMVYTAKMMYGLQTRILAGGYEKASKILCLHTGGLQGNVSIKDKLIY
ncbi:MAG: pyridoxal-phosphate dependent enzyme [Taibaiella sp.]|nr:pyridoxal-phosphate dependent enzyme [Taibaiella sp.]